MGSSSYHDGTTVEKIKQRLPLETYLQRYTKLSLKGKNWVGLCPFHQEKTPSFFVYPYDQRYKCFGCGENGDIFNFVEKRFSLSFLDALKRLTAEAGIELRLTEEPKTEKKPYYEILNQAAQFFQTELEQNKNQGPAQHFLKQRKLSQDLQKKFLLGLTPKNSDGLFQFLKKNFSPDDILQLGLAKQDEKGNFYDFFRLRLVFPDQRRKKSDHRLCRSNFNRPSGEIYQFARITALP